jgi:hypothetical protein
MTTPRILTDIVAYLKNCKINIRANIEGEGRAASLVDEGAVKTALYANPQFKDHLIDEKARGFSDITILDYDGITKHPVNIKTSLGGTDNCFSKSGLLYALSTIPFEEIPGRMDLKTWVRLINENKPIMGETVYRDYWYLCIDKSNSENVIVRGSKQINTWTPNINQSNILQVNWKREKTMDSVERTWDEAYTVIVGNVKRSVERYIAESIPEEWLR